MFEEIMKALEAQKETLGVQFGTIAKQVEDLCVRMKELETLATPRKVSLPGVNEGKDQFSFMKAVYGIRTGDWNNAGFEKEVFDQAAKKAMSQGNATAGGYIVPSQYVAEIIEMLRANTIVMKLGASVLNDLYGSPIELPKQLSGATAYWVDENADITPSDLGFGQLSLQPKQVAAMVKLSNRLLKLSNPSAEALVRNDIALTMALAIDLAALRGSGVGAEPLGLANTPGILTYNARGAGNDGVRFTFDHAQAMEGKLEDANALRGKLAYAMNPKVKRLLKSQKIAQYSGQTDGEYVVGLPMSDAKLADALGYGFSSTTQIPANLTVGAKSDCSEVYFGNWSELIIGQWGGMEIMASTEAGDSFQKNQTWVRIIQEVDCGLRHSQSFCLTNDASTTGA